MENGREAAPVPRPHRAVLARMVVLVVKRLPSRYRRAQARDGIEAMLWSPRGSYGCSCGGYHFSAEAAAACDLSTVQFRRDGTVLALQGHAMQPLTRRGF